MIAKIFRLKEAEVKKVLRKGKPFFSESMVANISNNRLAHPRFAIILSSKVVWNAVHRNFFRRQFYTLASSYSTASWIDVVVVIKKWRILTRETISIERFNQESSILFSRIFSSHERSNS